MQLFVCLWLKRAGSLTARVLVSRELTKSAVRSVQPSQTSRSSHPCTHTPGWLHLQKGALTEEKNEGGATERYCKPCLCDKKPSYLPQGLFKLRCLGQFARQVIRVAAGWDARVGHI